MLNWLVADSVKLLSGDEKITLALNASACVDKQGCQTLNFATRVVRMVILA